MGFQFFGEVRESRSCRAGYSCLKVAWLDRELLPQEARMTYTNSSHILSVQSQARWSSAVLNSRLPGLSTP